MAEKLDNLNSQPIVKKNLGICEYIALGCKGAQDSANYQIMCSIHRGAGCGLKVILPSSYLPTGELL
jgi:hypothetical protein